jgi:hypothetical protein
MSRHSRLQPEARPESNTASIAPVTAVKIGSGPAPRVMALVKRRAVWEDSVMAQFHGRAFPGKSAAYRAARDALLASEAALREQTEAVAAPPADYTFAEAPDDRPVRLSELFRPGQDTLVVYSYMVGSAGSAPCPLCTSMLDSLDGAAPHIGQHVGLAVVAKAPASRLAAVPASAAGATCACCRAPRTPTTPTISPRTPLATSGRC